MNRKTCIFATLVAFLLVLAQAGFAQNLLSQPNPNFGQLIAWSQLQNPKPLPEPRPDPAPSPGTPQEQQPKSERPDSAVAQQQQLPVQTLTGTITKEDGKYVLKASDSKTYQIDDQDKARQFEGKQVKIVGSLDPSTGTIHLQSIEPAS
jgi:Protein of unknown function (DUF5818)